LPFVRYLIYKHERAHGIFVSWGILLIVRLCKEVKVKS